MANHLLSWGKCTLFVKGSEDNNWTRLVTPVEDSTNLASTQGDKLEAKVEGGENEAVKYKKNTYQLTFNIRKANGRAQPFPNTDGVVKDEYSVILQPEDSEHTDGFYIERCSANIQDTFTTAEGAIWQTTMDALKPESGNTVKWGKVTVVDSGSTHTVAFAENEEMVADGASAISVSAEAYVDQNDSE